MPTPVLICKGRNFLLFYPEGRCLVKEDILHSGRVCPSMTEIQQWWLTSISNKSILIGRTAFFLEGIVLLWLTDFLTLGGAIEVELISPKSVGFNSRLKVHGISLNDFGGNLTPVNGK